MSSRSRLFGALDPAMVRCPFPLYAELRKEPPIWVAELESYVVTRFDDVQAVLRDATTFSSSIVQGPVAMRRMSESMRSIAVEAPELAARLQETTVVARAVLLGADGEEHRRRRALVNKAFTPRRVKVMEPQIAAIANALVDAFLNRGRVELVSEFSTPLPLRVIATAIGVPEDDIATFRRWSEDIFTPLAVTQPTKAMLETMVAADRAFVDYFSARVEERRLAPASDILSDLVRAEEGGQRLTRSETLVICAELLAAGHETTMNLITALVLTVARNHELMTAIQADPAVIPALVEEVLRLDGPIQGSFRMAAADTTVGGVDIGAGSHLFLVFGAANRDERQLSNGEQLDLSRSEARKHFAFGRGVHACVGSELARTEARIALETLLRRLDLIELATSEDALHYIPSYVARGIVSLPLRFSVRGAAKPVTARNPTVS
jgi:cytochrome P450